MPYNNDQQEPKSSTIARVGTSAPVSQKRAFWEETASTAAGIGKGLLASGKGFLANGIGLNLEKKNEAIDVDKQEENADIEEHIKEINWRHEEMGILWDTKAQTLKKQQVLGNCDGPRVLHERLKHRLELDLKPFQKKYLKGDAPSKPREEMEFKIRQLTPEPAGSSTVVNHPVESAETSALISELKSALKKLHELEVHYGDFLSALKAQLDKDEKEFAESDKKDGNSQKGGLGGGTLNSRTWR